MKIFVLSQKNIPDIDLFHKKIKETIPEFVGLEIEDGVVSVELSVEVAQDIIDAIEAITPPQKPLQNVSPRQFRQALVLSNISIESIDNAINNLPEPQKSLAKIEWEFSVSFERNRPLVSQVAQILGKTEQDIDNLWTLALSL